MTAKEFENILWNVLLDAERDELFEDHFVNIDVIGNFDAFLTEDRGLRIKVRDEDGQMHKFNLTIQEER